MLVEAHIGVHSRHADVDARLTRNVTGVGFPEPTFVQNFFRQFDHIDVIVAPASHGSFK